VKSETEIPEKKNRIRRSGFIHSHKMSEQCDYAPTLFNHVINIYPSLSLSLSKDSELELNVVSLLLNMIRYLLHNNDIVQDRIQRNDGISLLGFLIQRLPRRFVDINLLRICQEFVIEANRVADRSLINSVHEHLIFDFRIWNKADYEIRIGHIQYISTIIKDDKKYFRRKYGIQFFLDILKTYFSSANSSSVNNNSENNELLAALNEEDLRNLRNSFFGMIKFYAKEIKIGELNAIVSFLSATRNMPTLQNDLCDLVISLLESPNSNEQIYLLFYEPNVADSLYALVAQVDLEKNVQRKLIRIIRVLLRTKRVYDKSKARLKLEECGTYAGFVSKIVSEYTTYLSNNSQYLLDNAWYNEHLVLDLLENLLMDEANVQTCAENVWHIVSLLNMSSQTHFILNYEQLVRVRLKCCEMLVNFLFANPGTVRALARAPAWQDVLCQYLCAEKKPGSIDYSNAARKRAVSSSSSSSSSAAAAGQPNPPIVVSPSSTMSSSYSIRNESSVQVDNEEDEDVWEEKNSGQLKNESAVEVVLTPELVTQKKKSLIKQNNSTGLDEQNDFNTKLTNKNRKQFNNVTSTLMKSGNMAAAAMSNEFDAETRNLKKILVFQNSTEQPPPPSSNENNHHHHAESLVTSIIVEEEKQQAAGSSATEAALFESEETGQLFAKVMLVIYRLNWEGIVGSSEEIWKVNH
jgi:hypothetical protein